MGGTERTVENRDKKGQAMKQRKKELRREIRALRAAHSDEEIHAMSLQVLERVRELSEYRQADTIFVYVDCKHETETADLIRQAWADGKRTAVPRVLGQEMKFFYITSLEEDLEDGYFGIREPYEKNPADGAADAPGSLMFMPGVAFDESRHRIGYGGGFYDRYLEAHPGLRTVALAFEFQVKPEVPFEEFDIRPGKIVTEKRVIQ